MIMEQGKKYYAFISYSHKDEEWAKWLQHKFEHYHLPITLNGMPNVPDNFRPIFRDIDELSGGELKPQISKALSDSAYLIIICSPNSAKSLYVDGEIREFIEIGKQNGVNNIGNIFPFIIEGVPHSKDNPSNECFPDALRELSLELIAGDAMKHGREHAFVKILSGTLRDSHIGFSMLWNRYERERIEEERKERERKNRLLMLESRYLSEKALEIARVDSQLARMLVLRALPTNLNDPEDRPYCVEAENALRRISNYRSVVIKTGEKGIKTFNLNSEGNQGVSVSIDGIVRRWDLRTGLQIGDSLKGHSDEVLYATYSHNDKIIATCSKDSSIILWNAETQEQIDKLMVSGSTGVKSLVFTSDDSKLVALSDTLTVWDMKNRCILNEIQIPHSNDIAIDGENRWIALATLNFSIEIYDLKNFQKIKVIPKAHSESLTSVDFSPNGERIVSVSFDGKLKVWDWMNGKILYSKNVGKVNGAYSPAVLSTEYSKDGNYIVTASRDGNIRIWDAISGEQEGKSLVGHSDSITSVHFCKEGSYIAFSSLDGTIRIWDLFPKVPFKVIGRARYIPFDSKKSHNEYMIEIDACNIVIRDHRNGNVIKTLRGHKKNINSAIFSPDGTKIVSTSYDGTARLWSVYTGEQIGSALDGHSMSPHTAAFNADGSLLVTASAIELKVWDVNTNVQLGLDLTTFDDFYKVVFLDNGRGILSETEKDYDILFDWEPLQELINRTRMQIGKRNFTELEKRRYYLE